MSVTSLRPSTVEVNVLANLLGTGTIVLIGLAFVPIYVDLLGIEAYGLVGFYVAITATLQILDFGLSPTINRELARITALPDYARSARDMVRTLEIPYWILGIAVGAIMALGAGAIARHWLQVSSLPVATAMSAVKLMGVVFILQWPISLYQGGLQGLQRQPLLNAINVTMALVRNIGAVLVLTYLKASVVAFFNWQILAAGLHVLVLMLALWAKLPASAHRPRFSSSELRRTWRFAAGMSIIALTAIILMQIDKLVLSRQLDLKEFGYYALAAVVGTSLVYVTGPVFNAVFPRFSALVARDERLALTQLYHRATQFLAVILLPAAFTLALLALAVMRTWTWDPLIAEKTHLVVAFLAIGSAINGLMTMPYALQLAHGWTSLSVRINLFLVSLAVPMVILMGSLFGGPGAAAVWILTNAIYMLVGVPAIHRRLMPGETRRWLLIDIGGPLIASLAVILVGSHFLGSAESRLLEGARIAVVLLAAICAAATAAPLVREWAAARLRYAGSSVSALILKMLLGR